MTLAEDLATAQARLAAIDEALANPVRATQFSDRSVTYRSVDELLAARAFCASEVARLSSRPRQTLGVASKGFV